MRKQTPEPVFGISKSVIGFHQFLLRELDRVRGEWSFVTMAWNINRPILCLPTASPSHAAISRFTCSAGRYRGMSASRQSAALGWFKNIAGG